MTQRDQCKTAAMINDNSAYGEALANNILDSNQRRVRFIFSQSVRPSGRYQHLGPASVPAARLIRVRRQPQSEHRRDPRCVRDGVPAAYGRAPDPYAVYAFEAMRIALDAIAATTTGGREAVRDALFAATEQPDSILGPYSLTPNGDKTVATSGVSRIVDGRLTAPRTAPRLARR